MKAPQRLITDDMAYAAALRAWGKDECNRVALAVVWGRYGEDDARAELATFLAHQAEKAGIKTVSCRMMAASMLTDELAIINAGIDVVRWEIVDVIRAHLDENPGDYRAAAEKAAIIARAKQVPPGLISFGMSIATRGR
jgi:hypothetical protein